MSEFKNLYATVMDRKLNPEEGSYTSYLYAKGLEKILKKIGEESTEVVISAMNGNDEELIREINDLAYHVAVLMAEKGITVEQVEEVMKERSRKTHNLKAERKPVTQL